MQYNGAVKLPPLLDRLIQNPFVRALVGGFCLGVGYVVPGLWLLVFVGLIPLFFLLTDKKVSLPKAALASTLAGFIFYGFIFSFDWTILPLDWLGVATMSGTLLVLVIWTIEALTFTVMFVAFCLSVRYMDLLRRPALLALIPIVWIACEWLGSLFFSAVNYGPGVPVEALMSFQYLGNILANNSVLLQLASFGGVYVLSAVVVMINLLTWLFLTGSQRTKWVVVATVVIGVGLLGIGRNMVATYNANQPSSSRLNIAFMSLQRSSVSSKGEVPDFTWVHEALLKDSTTSIDAILFPEGFGSYSPKPDDFRAIDASSSDAWRLASTTIIGSGASRDADGVTSIMTYYTPGQEPRHSYKYFLVPIGEYMPWLDQQIFALAGYGSDAQAIQTLRGHVSIPASVPIPIQGIPVATLFCNEAASPSLYQDQTRQGAQILLNTSAQGWFHGSSLVARLMENVAKIRAVENRRSYVQSSYISPAFVLDAYGREVVRTPRGEASVRVVPVETRDDKTLYVQFGHLVPLLCTCLWLVCLVAVYVRDKLMT